MLFYQNELPFRAIIQKIGWSSYRTAKFQWTTWKKCKENVHSKPRIAFESIDKPLQHSVEKEDLSTEQRLVYEYTKAIGSGKVDEKYSSWKVGQLHHARWLTLAMRFFAVYIHGNNLQAGI